MSTWLWARCSRKSPVTGDTVSAIETDSPTISGTFTTDDANNLPVNTRASFSGTSAANIFGALPGVQADSSGISLQGALPYQVDVTVDGVTTKSATGGNFIGDAFPSTESISEIRADGVLANAEFGDPGQIVVTTKGGTNTLCTAPASGITRTRPSMRSHTPSRPPPPSPALPAIPLAAAWAVRLSFRTCTTDTTRASSLALTKAGGIPRRQTISEVVPSTLMKQGDFSKYMVPDQNGNNTFTGLNDPYTGGSYGTKIPTDPLNSIALSTLKQFYPDPNIGDPTAYTDNGVANYQANVDASGHSNQFDVRGDQYFGSNQKFLLWGKFTWKNFPTTNA